MGFRMSKSFKLAPGVRMTVSKSGVSYSAGVRGARVTRRANGRVTGTASLPGTGMSYSSNLSRGTTSRPGAASPARTQQGPPAVAARPGLLAPRSDKDLFKAIARQQYQELPVIAAKHPHRAPLCAALEGLVAFQNGQGTQAANALEFAFRSRAVFETDPFVRKYIAGTSITIEVVDGVSVTLPLSREAVGLALAELHQAQGDLPAAIAAVESLEPTFTAALSLAELYSDAGRHDDVVRMTNGVRNETDASAVLCMLRGIALREQGHHVAAREAFKESLRRRSAPAEIRHRALVERARTHEAEGKKSLARKDLERVLAADAAYPGLQEALGRLA
jgi:tetratricopeptide (TPR) repeat protein